MTAATVNPALAKYTAEQLRTELEARAGDDDADAVAELQDVAEVWSADPSGGDEYYEPDALFQRMSDWDREELERAVAADDGRRAVDILRGQLA